MNQKKTFLIVAFVVLASFSGMVFPVLNVGGDDLPDYDVAGFVFVDGVPTDGVNVTLSVPGYEDITVTSYYNELYDKHGVYIISFYADEGQYASFIVKVDDDYFIPDPDGFLIDQPHPYSFNNVNLSVDTSSSNSAPDKPTNPSPENNSEDVNLNPILSVEVTDPDDDTMNISFYNASDDSLIDIATNVTNGSTASVDWPDLSYNTTYHWYASASDGQAFNDSEIWHFTTESKPNTPPIVDDILNQTITEGENFTTINLDDYVWDAEDPDENITWSYSGNIELEVDINTTNRVATITPPDENWNGQENITFTATDTGGLSDSDNATFTVTPVNDPPVVSNITDQTIAEGEKFVAINLDDYVEDLEDPDENINWSYSGNTRLTVSIVDQIATITTPNPDWNGQETITFTAEDTGGLNDSDNAAFTVTAVNDPPKVEIDKPERAVYINNEKKLPRLIRLALIIGDITIEVNATDVDSRIEKVEFYINGKLMGNDTTDPYTYNWTRDRLRLIHIFCIKVIAYDNDGGTAEDRMIVRKFL